MSHPAPTLAKGQNAPVPAGPLVVETDCAAPADLSALLVTDNGKVRSDADFVFYNQPEGPGVRCAPPSGGGQWQIRIEPGQVPAEISQIRTVLTLADAGRRFADVPPPTARLTTGSGAAVVAFPMTGLSSESIVIGLELYRRGNDWKVRAVGQGYAGGFAALVRDHGVSVDDDGGGDVAAAAPAAGPVPIPAGLPSPGGYPAAPPPGPVGGYPAPQSPPPPAAVGGYPPSAAAVGGYPPQPPPPGGAYGGYPAPPPAPGVAAPGYLPSGAPIPTGGGEISLRKGERISLQKGQKVSLRKEDGSSLTRVRMGLGWEPASRRKSIDLDASAVMFEGTREYDLVAFTNLHSADGSINHSGDNLTGEGSGDDEVISVDLSRIPPPVTTVCFTVTSYRGQTFAEVRGAYCRLIDDLTGQEMVRYSLDGGTPTTGMIMAVLQRGPIGWRMQAVGQGINATVPDAASRQAVAFLPPLT